MELTRRELAPLALTLAAACASPAPPATAQQPRRPSARPQAEAAPPMPAVPRPVRPGDIAGLVIEGTEAAESTLLLGLAFAPGDLPRGAGLAARRVPGDQPIAVSLRVLARHPDGSVKTALLGLTPPALRPRAHLGVLLERVATPPSAL